MNPLATRRCARRGSDVFRAALLKTVHFSRRLVLVGGLSVGVGIGFSSTTLRAAPAGDAGWAAHIEPLFKEHCAECHNPTKTKSGLDLSSLQSILKGGDRGAAVLPGRPEESNLYR